MSDILRTWSQLLTVEETQVWNEISCRDLTRDILTPGSGLRTTKSIIDREIRQFRQIDEGRKSEMLKALQQLPELTVDNNPDDPTDIPEAVTHPLSGDELPAVSNLNPGFISNYCDPLSNNQVEKPIIQTVKSDIDYLILKNNCARQYYRIRDQNNNRMKLQKVLDTNSKLLFQYMLLLKSKCTLGGQLSSAFKKLMKCKKINFRMIKKICFFLCKYKLIDPSWLNKPVHTLIANSVDLGLMISAYINGKTVCCILDTGSTYSLIPHKIWKTLKVNPNLLDSSITYNINSASHKVTDAVLGRISLAFQIVNSNGEKQSIFQTCLILREHLDLQYILLGNDFLTANSVKILYLPTSKAVSINDQNVEMIQSSSSQMVDIFSATLKKFSNQCKNVTRNLSIENLSDDPVLSHEEILPEPPPDILSSKTTYSNHVYDEDSRTDIQQFFNLCPEDDQGEIAINTFLSECKSAKYNYFNQSFVSYSAYDPNLDEMVKRDFEKKSIIPDEGIPCPKPNISHLSQEHQERMNRIINRHDKLFSRSKHHLGKFKGFQAVAHIDKDSKIKCKQPPRNRILPKSCKRPVSTNQSG